MPSRPKSLIPLFLTVLILLAGCGSAATGGGGGGDSGEANVDVEYDGSSGGGSGGAATRTPMATAEPESAENVDAAAGTEQASASGTNIQQRAIIRTGRLQLEVDSFESSQQNLTETTRMYGGFVSDTTQELHRAENETWTTGTVVLRIPAENFSTVLEAAKAEGTVEAVDINQRDVTDQLVDIQARLKNLRAERERLRTLYEQASDTEDVLKVQQRLADVQGQIERIEARQRALQQKVAFSTLRVQLGEPRPEPTPTPEPPAWYDTGVIAAFLESVSGVVTVLRALVIGFAFALPYLLVFGVPMAAVVYLLIRHQRRQSPFGGSGGSGGD